MHGQGILTCLRHPSDRSSDTARNKRSRASNRLEGSRRTQPAGSSQERPPLDEKPIRSWLIQLTSWRLEYAKPH